MITIRWYKKNFNWRGWREIGGVKFSIVNYKKYVCATVLHTWYVLLIRKFWAWNCPSRFIVLALAPHSLTLAPHSLTYEHFTLAFSLRASLFTCNVFDFSFLLYLLENSIEIQILYLPYFLLKFKFFRIKNWVFEILKR